MNDKKFEVPLEKNPIISMSVIPGHFSTSVVHTNYYLDVGTMKANAYIARDVAQELAIPYVSRTMIETIVCMQNTKTIGAFLAQELLREGTAIMNSGGEINVVSPMNSVDGKWIFYDNEVEWINNRHVLLLMATISSDRTLQSAIECLEYYNGIVSGISSLFSYSKIVANNEVNALFTPIDVPGCKIYLTHECELCKAGQPLEAFISNEGFRMI